MNRSEYNQEPNLLIPNNPENIGSTTKNYEPIFETFTQDLKAKQQHNLPHFHQKIQIQRQEIRGPSNSKDKVDYNLSKTKKTHATSQFLTSASILLLSLNIEVGSVDARNLNSSPELNYQIKSELLQTIKNESLAKETSSSDNLSNKNWENFTELLGKIIIGFFRRIYSSFSWWDRSSLLFYKKRYRIFK
jgi:hypothetical protein